LLIITFTEPQTPDCSAQLFAKLYSYVVACYLPFEHALWCCSDCFFCGTVQVRKITIISTWLMTLSEDPLYLMR